MIFEEMFESAKTALQKATVEDPGAWAAMQITVTGDGAGIFYVKVAEGVLDVQPYDYRDHDVALTVDSALLLDALTKKKTEMLELIGDAEKVAMIHAILATIPAARKRRASATAVEDKPAAKAPAKSSRCCKKPAAKTATPASESAKTETTATATETVKPAATTTKTETVAAKAPAATAKTAEKTVETKTSAKTADTAKA